MLKKRANVGKVPTQQRAAHYAGSGMRFEEASGMARSMVPSSFECDCGHQSHFCEGTVRDMEADSRRRHKRMLLLDSEAEEHAIEFEGGVATAVICPKQGRRKIMGWS
jgi:hypothetical protein